jgi:transketolase
MQADFRDAVFLSVRTLMEQDERIFVLCNDMGAMELDRIRSDYPQRVINVGICEQNMASVAAGLALTHRRVFVYGIIAHVFSRGFEQIRNDICLPNLPVVILGVGSGLSYGGDGPTHHGVEDIAVMRTLPHMAIYNPADCASAGALTREAAERHGPGYVRLDKEQLPQIYSTETSFSAGFEVLHEGQDVALVATGVIVHRALRVARSLAAEGIGVRVVDVYRLKPINPVGLTEVLSDADSVVTLEENSSVGGLGQIVGDLLARDAHHPRFTSLNLGDQALMSAATRSWAEQRFGLNDEAVANVLCDMTERVRT